MLGLLRFKTSDLLIVLGSLSFAFLLLFFFQTDKESILFILSSLGAVILIYLYIWKFTYFFSIFVFIIPLSLPFEFGDNVLSIPTEILVFALAAMFILKILFIRIPDKAVLTHPLSLLILLDIMWTFFTAINSTIVEVSMKRFAIKIIYLTVFYFSFSSFMRNEKHIWLFFISYAAGMVIPMINTLINHMMYGFIMKVSFYVTEPFYTDHTIYAACLAFILTAVLSFLLRGNVGRAKIPIAILCVLLSVSVFFSYSRAAWSSLIVALLLFYMMKFNLLKKIFFVFGFALVVYGVFNYRAISDKMEENLSVSSSEDIAEHIQSFANISNDASNAERLNRFSCALRMFYDRPLLGFGPGIFQFKYGMYQRPEEMTRISTYKGDKGNAHSEYFTALSETGIIGLLILLSILWTIFKTSWSIYKNAENQERKFLSMTILLCLTTYYVHGFVNTFLDVDKAAVLVYTCFGMVTALSLNERAERSF